MRPGVSLIVFLSIQAQDFIEDDANRGRPPQSAPFLSIQAQDFIEDCILAAILAASRNS